MRNSVRQIFLLLGFLFFSVHSLAESGNYRVEVLVFNHINTDAVPQEIDELRSFSEFPDLGEALEPYAPVKLDVMSDLMQANMRRLRSSADFHPILFASWEQSRIDYHPPVRIHDEELIAQQLNFPHEVVFVDLRGPDIFQDYMAPYFRLDGTVQLQRTRFLHIYLDMEFRQDLLPRMTNTEPQEDRQINNIVIDMAGGTSGPDEGTSSAQIRSMMDTSPGPALVHRITQNKQIRTDALQYFDSPYLGVLVRVTATSGQ